MYRSESFGCLKCSTQTKVVMTPVPCAGTTGPMVLTGTYELRAAVYKVYHLSPKMSASCVLAAFRVANHTGNGVRSVRHSEGCHTVSQNVLLQSVTCTHGIA
jgi:hypothetical protein